MATIVQMAAQPNTIRHTPERLTRLAVEALRAEADLTPKPGLVDRRGGGAHGDMNLELMHRSIAAIAPGLLAMAKAADSQSFSADLREGMGRIGRETEARMLAATGGVNTHRGAIWAMGLLISSVAMHNGCVSIMQIMKTASLLARFPDRLASNTSSHGKVVEQLLHYPGARGEAVAGFPHVIEHGLPSLRSARARGRNESCVRIDALLAIMAHLPDTCVLYRGGVAGLTIVQRGAAKVLRAGGIANAAGRMALTELEEAMLRFKLSPGGSADLLGATLFLDSLATDAVIAPIPIGLREGLYAGNAV